MSRIVLFDKVVLYDREGWGARTDIPRLGYNVDRERRTHEIIHHSVVIDSDATVNFWETEAEVHNKMRQLQTIRPDLGLDVPYNFVAFLMVQPHRYFVVCEGRGLDKTGAHTHGHNTAGIALCFQGDFHNYATDVGPWIPYINLFNGWMQERLPNLGTIHPVGMDMFGHRDFSQTACQGDYLYNELGKFSFTRDTMPTCEEQLAYAMKVLERVEKEREYAIAIAKELKRRTDEAVAILVP